MEASTARSPARSVTSVDLGPMKERVMELSAAAGVGPSTWLRDLVHREVGRIGAADGRIAEAADPEASEHGPYRTWLDAGLTAKLDRVKEANGFRTRPAALRALLEGIRVAGGGGASTEDAVREIGESNSRLVAIARNVNQIAKSLQSGGKLLTADRIALDEAVLAIHKHVEVAALLVSELRPMLKREKKS